ncbi:MAG TPA: arginase family protein, partial [Bacteroidia bacterium]|nr:arginase family protein [Bacteroidia bacterium]
MSDIMHFFTPVNAEDILMGQSTSESQFGSIFQIYKSTDDFPELEDVNMAIVGVCEDRNAPDNSGSKNAPDAVRAFLYKLFGTGFTAKVADLGNIMPGHSTEDTYFALRSVVDHLVRKNIIPIILGGSQDLTYAQFLGYKDLEQTINMVSVDSVFDLGNPDEEIANHSYLGKIILHQPNFLFNYSNMGYQTYLVDQNSLGMMTKLYFDFYRLGQIRD